MMQLLLGMLLGVMAATPTGRSEKVKEAVQAPLTGEEDNHGESA